MNLVSVTSELIRDVVEYIFPSRNLADGSLEHEFLMVNTPLIETVFMAVVVTVVVAVVISVSVIVVVLLVVTVVVVVVVMVDFQVDCVSRDASVTTLSTKQSHDQNLSKARCSIASRFN